MTASKAFLAAALIAGFAAGCSDPPTEPEPLAQLPRALTAPEQAVVSGSNVFAFGLLREIAARDTSANIFASPLSASMALGMTMNGAQGETLDGMRQALGFGSVPLADVNASYRGLIDLLRGLDEGVDFRIANSIWMREGFPVRQEFTDIGKSYFDAQVATLDFRDPSAPTTINEWVDRSTNGRIRSIIDDIPDSLVMYLVNAIYFKGSWTQRFDPSRTRDAPFTRLDGTTSTVKMMWQDHVRPRILWDDGVQVLDLPYGRGAFSMTIVLPPPGASVDSLLASIDEPTWRGWMGGLHDTELTVGLPRFRMEWEAQLNDELKTLGMDRAFDPNRADFGAMTPQQVFISDVVQKTFVEVNEEGTEAAAATSVGMGATSATQSFLVDRPFLVAIRERFSGTILFLGRIGAPQG
jgi:serpin B